MKKKEKYWDTRVNSDRTIALDVGEIPAYFHRLTMSIASAKELRDELDLAIRRAELT